MRSFRPSIGLALAVSATATLAAENGEVWRFDLNGGPPQAGVTSVEAAQAYEESLGYGFEHGNAGEDSFVFSVRLPEGNYHVRAVLEDAAAPPESLTIKAESRRLMIENARLAADDRSSLEFAVHIRTNQLEGGGEVDLNEREIGVWHWDDRLQLEFNGEAASVDRIEITAAPRMPTLFIAGDSTVTDQPREPWVGWGQMLPRFFDERIAVANFAESGLALRSFRAQRRLEKVFEQMKPGDFLFIQFGHNDMKERGAGIGPWESYSDDLRQYVRQTRAHGGIPVLITSMQRRRFDEAGRQPATLGDYPLAVRRVAAELDVPLIDLNLMSAAIYAALGPEDSKRAFVHYPAGTFPGQDQPLRDDTHFNPYGGYQLARAVVEGIRRSVPELAAFIRPDVEPYDPARPDPFDSVNIPPSPRASFEKPAGD